MWVRATCVLLWLWVFARLVYGQGGGSYGFTSAALNGSCNVTGASAYYIGCQLAGSYNASLLITRGQVNATSGYGFYSSPFFVENSGDQSLPGFVTAGSNYWTTSETPLNCTIACKSHGFRYTILIMGLCSCSSYNSLSPPHVWTSSGFVSTDNLIGPLRATPTAVWPWPNGQNSACTNSYLGPPTIFCYGDRSQPQCGWRLGYYSNKVQTTYNDSSLAGQYAHAVYVDYSFPAWTPSDVSITQQHRYYYLGCFTNPNPLNSAMIPHGWNNTLFYQDCLLFCGGPLMAYAGMAANGDGTVNCVCGVSFSRNIYQLLPDSRANSQCNYNCVSGLQDGSCVPGVSCCGSGTTFAYFRNPNMLGCYEPPIPGTRVGSATYPAACFTSVYTGPVTTLKSLATGTATSGVLVIATTPPSPPWGFNSYPQYTYLGCFTNQTLLAPITSVLSITTTPHIITAEDCMAYCAANGTLYAAMTKNNVASGRGNGMWCRCSNNVQFINNQLPAWNCTFFSCGQVDSLAGLGLAYGEVCGGIEYDDTVPNGGGPIGLYGPSASLVSVALRTITPSSTFTCINSTSSSSSSSSRSSTITITSFSSSSSVSSTRSSSSSSSSVPSSSSSSSQSSSSSSSSSVPSSSSSLSRSSSLSPSSSQSSSTSSSIYSSVTSSSSSSILVSPSSSSSSISSSSSGLSSGSSSTLISPSSSLAVLSSSSSEPPTSSSSSIQISPSSSLAVLSSSSSILPTSSSSTQDIPPSSSSSLLDHSSSSPGPSSSSSSVVQDQSSTALVLLSSTAPVAQSSAVPTPSTSSQSSSFAEKQVSSSSSSQIPTPVLSPAVGQTSTASSSSTQAQVPPGDTSSILSISSQVQIPPVPATSSTSQLQAQDGTTNSEGQLPQTTNAQQATQGTSLSQKAPVIALSSAGTPLASPPGLLLDTSTQAQALAATPTIANRNPTHSPTIAYPPVATSNVILQIMAIGLHKRQSSNVYLTPSSSDGDIMCDPSSTFTLSGGHLLSSDGRYLSTSDGVTWMQFLPATPTLSITTDFTLDSNGNLVWINSAFIGDQALFCEEASGQIDVLFQGQTDSNDPSYPLYGSTCTPINLRVVQGSACYNSTMSLAVTEGNAAATATCPVYPASWYTYSPSGVSCVPHTLTWEQFGCTPSPAPFL